MRVKGGPSVGAQGGRCPCNKRSGPWNTAEGQGHRGEADTFVSDFGFQDGGTLSALDTASQSRRTGPWLVSGQESLLHHGQLSK